MNPLYPLAAVGIGMAFALQPAINGTAARILGSPVGAAVLSVAITLACLLAVLPAFGGYARLAGLAALPWWVVLGGMIGAVVVAGSAAVAPATGAAVFIVCVIAGQLVGSALVDQFGAFGMPERPVGLLRAAGLVVVLIGVLMVRAE